jgi:rubrerythrin
MAFAEVTFGLNTFQQILKLVKEAKDLKDSAAIRAKVSEMYGLILEAQESAINARAAHSDQVERIRQLEEQIRQLTDKRAELSKYELKDLEWGAFAYMLKRDARGTEPPHWACANCYKEGEIRIMQYIYPAKGAQRWTCPRCNAHIVPSADGPTWRD